MWSFEGDYRRKPQQRLGGASKSRNIERLDLLSQLKADREEREVRQAQELPGHCTLPLFSSVIKKRKNTVDLTVSLSDFITFIFTSSETKTEGGSSGNLAVLGPRSPEPAAHQA